MKVRTSVLLLVVFACSAAIWANINLDSQFRWGIPPGAVAFKLRVLDSVNAPIPIADPVTYDPDGNGFVDVPKDDPDGDGFQTIDVDIWLTGQALGLVKFKVSPIDGNGNAGTEVGANETYAAPEIDPTTLSFINP